MREPYQVLEDFFKRECICEAASRTGPNVARVEPLTM